VPLTGHLWPLATHHRGHPSGPTGGGGAYGQSGSLTLATPIGRRRYGATPLTGHPGRPYTGSGSLPTAPTGEAGHSLAIGLRPHWSRPQGRRRYMAKGEPHPLTGHLPPDRPHWGGEPLPTGHTPPGATLWPKGPPHLRPHRGGGPSPTGHLRHRLPHWPPTATVPPLAREGDGHP